MPVFIIETNELHPDGNRKKLYIDTYLPNLVMLAADLRVGPVAVEKLFASRVDGEMVVRDRKDMIITAGMVYSASEPDIPFVEYEAKPE